MEFYKMQSDIKKNNVVAKYVFQGDHTCNHCPGRTRVSVMSKKGLCLNFLDLELTSV